VKVGEKTEMERERDRKCRETVSSERSCLGKTSRHFYSDTTAAERGGGRGGGAKDVIQ